MMAVITMLLVGGVFALAFHGLLVSWTSLQRRGWRVGAHLVLAVAFLVIYLGYSLGYLALFEQLARRWRDWADFGTWTDDVAAVVPFAIAVTMFWRRRATARSSHRAHPSPGT